MGGAHEEIAKLREQYTRAFNEGNLELMGALFADDATRFAPPDPFRAEGKAAILAQFAGTFQANPTRRMVARHGSIQVYGDSTAVYTGYVRVTLVDRAGRVTNVNNRFSLTFAKLGGKWLAVHHHASRLPAP
ncbi:MAG: SgcJ/EcaC family oxidoreductase [Deltaproteobacteria bacterium]|nr:SgcJ/EcaC family oxidoreductase [Deltaproteobacteria bacterium]